MCRLYITKPNSTGVIITAARVKLTQVGIKCLAQVAICCKHKLAGVFFLKLPPAESLAGLRIKLYELHDC